MADPQGVSIAFADATLEPEPTWTRIDNNPTDGGAVSWTIDRGRSSELDKTDTGVATVNIVDLAGDFDPTNSGGAFFGYLDPMKQAAIALYDPVATTWSTIYRGFVDEWLYDMDVSEKVLRVQLELADGFDFFAALEMNTEDYGDTVDLGSEGDIQFDQDTNLDACRTRINNFLDQIGWDSFMREIFSGNVGLWKTIYSRQDQALTVLLDVADAEFPGVANVYMNKLGYLTFHGRYARFHPDVVAYNINTWKAGDFGAADSDPDTAPISGLKFRRSKNDIINTALVLPQHVDDTDVPAQKVEDATSISNFGVRSISFENLLTHNGEGPTTALQETYKVGQYYVGNYKDPKTRVSSITFRPLPADHPNAAALWGLMCGVEINDIIELTTSHPGGGGFAAEEFFVEGIHYEAQPMHKVVGQEAMHEVTLELDLSPKSFYAYDPYPETERQDPDDL